MRLSFSTLGCPGWSFGQIMENAHEMGYEAVELRGVGNQLRMGKLECLRPENRGALKCLLEKNQLKLCVAGTSVQFHDAENMRRRWRKGVWRCSCAPNWEFPSYGYSATRFRRESCGRP